MFYIAIENHVKLEKNASWRTFQLAYRVLVLFSSHAHCLCIRLKLGLLQPVVTGICHGVTGN